MYNMNTNTDHFAPCSRMRKRGNECYDGDKGLSVSDKTYACAYNWVMVVVEYFLQLEYQCLQLNVWL